MTGLWRFSGYTMLAAGFLALSACTGDDGGNDRGKGQSPGLQSAVMSPASEKPMQSGDAPPSPRVSSKAHSTAARSSSGQKPDLAKDTPDMRGSPVEKERQAIGAGISELASNPADPALRKRLQERLERSDAYREDVLYRMRAAVPADGR